MKRKQLGVLFVIVLSLTVATAAWGDIVYQSQGSTLAGSPDYDWWYGCSPTSAGMMMGYYDTYGYAGLRYDNLVSGSAESSTFPSTAGVWEYNAQGAIASTGHVADFWGADDPVSHELDCLADFMYTSRGKGDGWTTFGYYVSGNPYHEANSSLGKGMYGIGQYVEYAGYDAATLYNQLLPGVADDLWVDDDGFPLPPNASGFTWDQYVAEIDAGRPVLIHVENHTMFGYGYGDEQTVYLHDTWTLGEKTMTWGGTYSGLMHYGVTVLELTGGVPVPVPAAVLIGMLGLTTAGLKLRKYV